jgi:hypothetical protein
MVGRKQFGGHFPEVFPCVPNVDDLDRAREVLLGDVPNPLGANDQHHLLLAWLQPRSQASV